MKQNLRITGAALLMPILPAMIGCHGSRMASPEARLSEVAAIEETLDALHHAAAVADEKVYFELYAPEAVFLGTDATERWTLREFKAFATPHFDGESAWVYDVIERHVETAPRGDYAWFDERLDNARLGETRGSGALRKINGDWKIVQYNLTMPVPNELADEVAEMVREWEATNR